MKIASLDLGSNTFLCLICEIHNGKIESIYEDVVEVVRLGQGLSETKNFHPDALIRAENCLKKFSDLILKHKPDRILAMATSAARDAKNQIDLLNLGNKFNIPIEIIPGNKEAEITYQGSVSNLKSDEARLVIDIGGGSTEFILGQGQNLIAGKSLNIGCVRLTEKYISAQPTSESDLQSLIQHIQTEIKNNLENYKRSNLKALAVAGTPTTLAAVELGLFDANKIDGYQFSVHQLEDWLRKILPLTVDEKIKLGFPPGRADVIIVGLVILIESLKFFNLSSLEVSTRGVRHGVALELFNRP